MSILRFLGGSLSRLLIRGFERVIAGSIARNITPESLTSLILGKEPQLGRDAAAALADFVKSGQRAAEVFQSLPSDQKPPEDLLPENPLLFGRDAQGDRYLVEGVVDVLGDAGQVLKQFRISARASTLESNRDVLDWMKREALERYKQYEPLSLLFDENDLSAAEATLYFGERRF